MAASRDAPRLASKELLLLLLFLQAAVKRLLENKEIIRINFIGQNKTFTKIYILMHNSVDVRRLDFIFLLTSDTSCEPPPYTQKVDLFFYFFFLRPVLWRQVVACSSCPPTSPLAARFQLAARCQAPHTETERCLMVCPAPWVSITSLERPIYLPSPLPTCSPQHIHPLTLNCAQLTWSHPTSVRVWLDSSCLWWSNVSCNLLTLAEISSFVLLEVQHTIGKYGFKVFEAWHLVPGGGLVGVEIRGEVLGPCPGMTGRRPAGTRCSSSRHGKEFPSLPLVCFIYI